MISNGQLKKHVLYPRLSSKGPAGSKCLCLPEVHCFYLQGPCRLKLQSPWSLPTRDAPGGNNRQLCVGDIPTIWLWVITNSKTAQQPLFGHVWDLHPWLKNPCMGCSPGVGHPKDSTGIFTSYRLHRVFHSLRLHGFNTENPGSVIRRHVGTTWMMCFLMIICMAWILFLQVVKLMKEGQSDRPQWSLGKPFKLNNMKNFKTNITSSWLHHNLVIPDCNRIHIVQNKQVVFVEQSSPSPLWQFHCFASLTAGHHELSHWLVRSAARNAVKVKQQLLVAYCLVKFPA